MNYHYRESPDYVAYYQNQAGGALPGYAGGGVMYGSGLGGIFRGLFRMAIPLLKRGFSIAKPHLKSAAKNIASDVFSNVLMRSHGDEGKAQGGSGLMVMARKRTSKPPGLRRRGQWTIKKKKTTRLTNKVSLARRKRKKTVRRNPPIKRGVKTIF
nr:TPA_asm: cupiennin [Pimephales minnow adintovirus]